MRRVNDKRVDPGTGERQRLSSAILPPSARKTPRITEVLPPTCTACRPGISCPALGQFLGSAEGQSGPVITKLIEQWKGRTARLLRGVTCPKLTMCRAPQPKPATSKDCAR